MRILFVIDSLRYGGKERRLVELMKGLAARPDIEYEIAVMSREVHFKHLSQQNVTIHYLIRRWSKDPGIFFKLRNIAKRVKPDIIHAWGDLAAFYALPVAKTVGAKFVNGYITYAARAGVFSKLWIGAKLTFPLSDAVVANSMAGLKAHGLQVSNRNVCIFNGFDFSRLDNLPGEEPVRKEFGIRTARVVGMTANFSPAKDYRTYLKAATKILEKRDDVTFLCIGSGYDPQKFGEFAKGASADNIRFLGRQESIESIVNILDIGVLACNTIGHAEGISNAIMEYMACGKPVVATDSGGNRELIVDNETGFIVPAFDAGTMASRIEELLDDAVKSKKMGAAGRERIENEFNLVNMTAAYSALYKRLIGDSTGGVRS